MRCFSSCTADHYDILSLYSYLKKNYEAQLFRDVIHITYPTTKENANVFFFSYGTFVSWGLSEEEEKQLASQLKPFETKPLVLPTTDLFTYLSGEKSKILKGEIILANQQTLTLLAFSHALAQSSKIDAFEEDIQHTYNLMKQIPEDLATRGRSALSRKEIRQKMGELFIARSSVNLHSDILDKPEFFWEYPEYEPLYTMLSQHLDLNSRVEVLNQRLGVIHELFEMLGNELNHQHSSRLEWTIIILILIEVVVTFAKDIFAWI